MANRPYALGMQHWLQGDLAWLTDNIKVALCSSSYTPNTATDEFLSIIPGGAIVATSANLASKLTTNGVAQGANPTFSSVSGSTITQFVIYNDTGVAGTSQLIALYDTASNLPLVPNGGNITIQWAGAPNYIFALAKALSDRDRSLIERLRGWWSGDKSAGLWIPTPKVVQI